MAGILANSASKTMTVGTADNAVSGYLEREQIVLTTNPTGTTYAWAIALPSGATSARSGLSAASGDSVTFTPESAGTYTVTCTVDGTTSYTIRVGCEPLAVVDSVDAVRFTQRADSTVTAPTNHAALALYNSTDQGGLVTKNYAGTVSPLAGSTTFAAVKSALAAADSAVDFNGQGITGARLVRVLTKTADYVMTETDDCHVAVGTRLAAVDITLPAGAAGQTITVKDASGEATTYPITVVGTVDGLTDPVIDTNRGYITVRHDGTAWGDIS